MIGGSGLLGGEGMMDPVNRARFATGLMGLPGMQSHGVSLLGQTFGQEMQNQQFMQRQNLDNARWMQEQLLKQQQRVGPFKDEAQYQTTLNPIMSAYEKAVSPYRTVLERLNKTGEMIAERGGVQNMTGADDMTMIRDFIKMTVPNEAVMSDDQRAAQLAANGYPGLASSFLNMLKGEGSLDTEGRATLFQTMQTIGRSALPQYQQVRDMFLNRAQRASLDPRDFMRPEMGMPTTPIQPPTSVPGGQVTRPERANIGTEMMMPAGVPFEWPDSPTGWAAYDEDGNIVVYEVQ